MSTLAWKLSYSMPAGGGGGWPAETSKNRSIRAPPQLYKVGGGCYSFVSSFVAGCRRHFLSRWKIPGPSEGRMTWTMNKSTTDLFMLPSPPLFCFTSIGCHWGGTGWGTPPPTFWNQTPLEVENQQINKRCCFSQYKNFWNWTGFMKWKLHVGLRITWQATLYVALSYFYMTSLSCFQIQ